MRRPGNIEPDLLRTFVCIAETGSFTAAAAAVGRTQSAISMQVRKLEQLLGHALFTRGRGSRVQLTRWGSFLLDRASEMLALHDAVWNEFHAPDGDRSPDPSVGEPAASASTPLRAQREAFTSQIMMTLLTNERFVEAYSLVMRIVERGETVNPSLLDPKSDDLFMGLLSMLEYVSINFLSNAIDRGMLLRQRRSGLVRVYETLRSYIDYKRTAWSRPNAYRSFETMIRDHALSAVSVTPADGQDGASLASGPSHPT